MLNLRYLDTEVTLAPERGAIVTSWKVAGQELLYLDQATFDDPNKNVRGGIPVLFPICGPLPQPEYAMSDSVYSMKQHGFARNLPWRVVEAHQHRAVLELTETPETLAQFPFEFSYRLKFETTRGSLVIGQEIRNNSARAMPIQFGFHPYFLVGEKSALEFALPVEVFGDNKSDRTGRFQGFDFNLEEIDLSFPGPTSRTAGFVDRERGIEVKVNYGDNYQTLVFWTLKGQPYVCVEPWSSSRLAFPDGGDVHRLEPNEVLRSHMTLTASFIK